jgi:hypothetical protein
MKKVMKKALPKAKYGRGVVSTTDGATYTKTGKKIGSGMGKKAEYRDFNTGEGDRSYASSTEGAKAKLALRKANKEATKEGKIQVQKKGGTSKPKKK